MRMNAEYEFAAQSPVGEYWLAHGVGFTVTRSDGRRVGVLEEVVVDPFAQRAERVIVRRRGLLGRRRVTIAPDAVSAVIPAAKRFVVSAPSKPAGSSTRIAGARVRHVLTRAVVAGRIVARRGAAASQPYLSAAFRGLVAALGLTLRLSGRGALAAARWIRREAPRLQPAFSASARLALRVAGSVLIALWSLGSVAGREVRELVVAATPRQSHPRNRRPHRHQRSPIPPTKDAPGR